MPSHLERELGRKEAQWWKKEKEKENKNGKAGKEQCCLAGCTGKRFPTPTSVSRVRVVCLAQQHFYTYIYIIFFKNYYIIINSYFHQTITFLKFISLKGV